MSADVAPPVPIAENAKKVPSESSSPKPSSQDGMPIMVDNSRENGVSGLWYWHEGEIIASLLAFDAASRQKQTITRVFRAKFAVGCYLKFAKKIQSEGKWDPKIEITKSRDVRLKYI